jgi:tetratricopeptide (TPR) repeat protein
MSRALIPLPAARERIVEQAGRWDETFAQLARLRPDEPLLHLALARQHIERGKAQEAGTERARARALFEKRIHQHPEYSGDAGKLADLLVEDALPWTVLEPAKAVSSGGATLTKQPDGSILAGGKSPDIDSYTIEAVTSLRNISGLRLEALPDPSLPNNGPGRGPNFPLTNLRVTAAPSSGPQRAVVAVLKNPFATFNDGPWHVSKAIDGDDANTGWGIWPRIGETHTAYFEMEGIAGGPKGTRLTILLDFKHPIHKKHILGRFRLSVTTRPRASGAEQFRLGLVQSAVSGWTKLAAAYSLRGEEPAARAALQKGPRATSETSAEEMLVRALLHGQFGQEAEARKEWDQAFALLAKNHAGEALQGFAGEVLSMALEKTPDDLSLLAHRALVLGRLGKHEQARVDFTKLLGTKDGVVTVVPLLTKEIERRPVDPHLWKQRALAYAGSSLFDKAAADFAKAMELLPTGYSRAPWTSSRPDNIPDELAAREDIFARVANLRPRDGRLWVAGVRFHAWQGQWHKAAGAIKLFDLRPDDILSSLDLRDWIFYACLQVLGGDDQSYQEFCRRTVARFDKVSVDAATRSLIARGCTLAPGALPDRVQALQMAKQALAGKLPSHSSWRAAALHVLGLAHYRAGQFEQAVRRSQESLEKYPRSCPYLNWPVLAMGYHRLGQQKEARKWLNKTVEWYNRQTAGRAKNDMPPPARVSAENWLEFQVLLREAKAVLRGAAPKAKK